MEYQKNLREAWGQALLALARRNPDVVALEADLGKSTRSILMKGEFPERCFEMGIAEQDMASTAAGLALAGKIPFMHSFAVFASGRAYDQLRNSVCIPHVPVRVCGSSAGLSDFGDGKTHQALEDMAIMRALPTMTVLCPADGIECAGMVAALETWPGPAYVRIVRAVIDGTSPGPVRLTKGSLSLRWRVWTPASFRSIIGSRPAAALPSSSSVRCRGSFFGHPCLRLHVPFSQGPWLDFHQLAGEHAGHTSSRPTGSFPCSAQPGTPTDTLATQGTPPLKNSDNQPDKIIVADRPR